MDLSIGITKEVDVILAGRADSKRPLAPFTNYGELRFNEQTLLVCQQNRREHCHVTFIRNPFRIGWKKWLTTLVVLPIDGGPGCRRGDAWA